MQGHHDEPGHNYQLHHEGKNRKEERGNHVSNGNRCFFDQFNRQPDSILWMTTKQSFSYYDFHVLPLSQKDQKQDDNDQDDETHEKDEHPSRLEVGIGFDISGET